MMSHNQEGTLNPEILPEEQGFQTPHQTFQLWGHTLERETPKHLALKTNGITSQDPQDDNDLRDHS